MTLLALDLNATRARAVSGPPGGFPLPRPLDPPALELPLIVSLEQKKPEVGVAGLHLCRQKPFAVCQDFLAHLGTTGPETRKWKYGPHCLESAEALALVFQRLGPACADGSGVLLSLPTYLTDGQAALVSSVAKKAGLRILGSVPGALALALAAHADQAWFHSVLVVDIDDHALTLSIVAAEHDLATVLETQTLPHLGLRVWKDRLLNSLADRCVRQSRRDPRESPLAEQALYEQLDEVLDACREGRMTQISLQGKQWYISLVIHPDEALAFCGGLVHQTMMEIEALWHAPWRGAPAGVLLSATAGRLPGLVPSLQICLDEWLAVAGGPKSGTDDGVEDFGEDLLSDGGGATNLVVLSADAPARAAHVLAGQIGRGDLPAGHLGKSAPLPLPQPADAGPPRLAYQGQEYLLNQPAFVLGRQRGCNLVFDGDVYLSVSARHCEIVFDRRSFTLFDRSREGTWVNDSPVAGSVPLHPGDSIRLGPEGPVLRFLGQGPDLKPLMTTA
jgi:hypothetical protein